MNKTLIIGLDLSFNSTGIVISEIEGTNGKFIEFHKVIFDHNSNKTDKKYTPQSIKNINIHTYRMPTNILVSDLVLDINDTNNLEQCEATLKAMICSKKIGIIIAQKILESNPTEVIVSIENYIMPAFSGQNQLKTVSGLIMLQGYVRQVIIRLCLDKNISFKLYTPTPSSNKLFFSRNGHAEKPEMLKAFLNYYDGNKLLPSVTIDSSASVNDVIDAFSLMMNAYNKHIVKK